MRSLRRKGCRLAGTPSPSHGQPMRNDTQSFRFSCVSVLGLLLFSGCDSSSESRPEGPIESVALDYDAIAERLLERLALKAGERVLLVGLPGRFDAMVPAFRAGVTAADAIDLGAWSVAGAAPEAWESDFTARLSETSGDARLELLREVDAAVMMPGATVTHSVYGGLQDLLTEGQRRTIHFHWAGAYALDGTLMEQTPEYDAFYQRVLHETDYQALAAAQAGFAEAMRGSAMRVTTPAGTDLSFRIGDRPVTRQDGDASSARAERALNLIDREVELPAGAIRVAPLEGSVNGTVAFPPSVWGDTVVEGLVLTFASGRVIDALATTGLGAVTAEMDSAGDAGRAFREFALGFNPLLAIPTEGDPWIPYYGYGAGVVRLSLGDNSELGGAVGGGYVRWNFFTDATVTVDGDVWVDGGRLVR